MRSCDQFSYLLPFTSAEYPVGVVPIFVNIMELIHGLTIRVLGPRPMQYDINPSGTTIGIAIYTFEKDWAK